MKLTQNLSGGAAVAAVLLFVFGETLAAAAPEPAQDSPSEDRLHGETHDHDVLEEVVVTATPLERDVIEISQSATVLRGAALDRELNNSIGETLARLPGLANASFGQNIGRPVIRGLQGARVGVLANNMTSADASAVSQDHAVPVEPFLADQVEVLRGPATLLYGSGSIGGVVNMVTNTIPQAVPENGITGRALIQGDSAADERFGAARIDAGSGSFAFHASGFYRRSDDYEIPGMAEAFPDDDDDHDHDEDHDSDHDDDHDSDHEEGEGSEGVLENSFLDNEGGSIGVAWIGERWRVGASYTAYDSDYGIPGAHAHHHEEDEHDDDGHDEDEHDEEEHDEEEHDEEEELVTIGLESRRFDAELVGDQPFNGFSQLKVKFADTDYEHTEFEGSEIGTVFDSQTTDVRLELRHDPWGRSTGAFGGQYTKRDFNAVGEEAFVPPSETTSGALFWVESLEFDAWQLDLGVRYEDTKIDSFIIEHDHEHEDEHDEGDEEHDEEGPVPASRDFNPLSLSLGAIWHINDRSHLAFNFARAERAPTDQELFSNGPHIATQTFEEGNPDLRKERNIHIEGAWRLHAGQLTGSIVVYANYFDNFIYLADTGEEEDGLPLRIWSQQDADFYGGEIELRYDIGRFSSGHWQVHGFADVVRGKFDDSSYVPRISPSRIGLGLDWDLGGWAATAGWIHASDHTRVAEYETPTEGYDLVNAEISYAFGFGSGTEVSIFLKGNNLLDEEIRDSTSYLKDQAPKIGRNFVLGVKALF